MSLTFLPAAGIDASMLNQSLNVSRNRLRELPESLRSLEELEELKASHNSIQDFPGSLLLGSKVLKRLDVSHNRLHSFPTSLSRFCPELEQLHLSENYLDADALSDRASTWTFQLKQLRCLDVFPQRVKATSKE